MITGIYLSILTFVYITLSARTITARKQTKIAVGAGESKKLLRASRAHANFAEYVPLTIILLFAIEYLDGNGYFLHIAGALLVLGRVVHAYGISQLKEQLNFRVFGMLCTFICMALSSCYLLYLSLVN
ncbi:MAPEG family protein [Vibrio nigripulchritudo]|uniref:MAPEG family protein n=1 Tax=Vibrio nigripulchritudo TaxID=28173 RepID=UPI002491B5B1|nr:MAPEG family protein [Vibrio nigripulchritudo]BDU39820.1 hypothetical protein TUMSATVNIG2_42890 [Vibrio nigripulchritudo]BDU45544.1 hypothetical protein TUMSATVNIG3_43420 [Vibrio nigripulchritudo]